MYTRRMSYPEAWLRGYGGRHFLGPGRQQPEGEHALQRALRVLEADPGASTQTRIETLIQMGDWHQIKKAPREALPYYQRAWQPIRKEPSLSSSAATALNVPVRVYYPTPSDRGSRPDAGRNALPRRADRVHSRR